MRRSCLVMLASLLLPMQGIAAADTSADGQPTLMPGQAIAAADAARSGQGAKGRFAMTVVATGRVGGAIFLNSSSDYRSPDDLSLRLSPNVVAALTHRYGSPPDIYLKGKTITVDGYVKRQLIVNTDGYFSRDSYTPNAPVDPRPVLSVNRWQHMVPILFEHQIVSVE